MDEYERYRSLKLAANFCEHAHESEGRWTLLRCYRGIIFSAFPAILRPMELFVLVTDAIGIAPQVLRVDLVDPERLLLGRDEPSLWQDSAQLRGSEFQGVYTARYTVPALPIRHAGRYDLHMEVDEHLVDLASLHLKGRP